MKWIKPEELKITLMSQRYAQNINERDIEKAFLFKPYIHLKQGPRRKSFLLFQHITLPIRTYFL